MSSCGFLVFAVLWTVVHADRQNSLSGKFREDITLNTGAQLHGEYEIIWSRGQKVLLHYDGEWITNATEKYQLDEKTGSLTIGSLAADDGGLYQVQIFIGSKRTANTFNLTVVGAPAKYPPTPAQDPSVYVASQSSPSADHPPEDPDPKPPTGRPWLHWIAAVLVLLAGACVVLAIVNRVSVLTEIWLKGRGVFWAQFRRCDLEDTGTDSEEENQENTPV